MARRTGHLVRLVVSIGVAVVFLLGGILLTPTWGSGVCVEMQQEKNGKWIKVGEEWGPTYTFKRPGWPVPYALVEKEGCRTYNTTVEWDMAGLLLNGLCAVGLGGATYLILLLLSRRLHPSPANP